MLTWLILYTVTFSVPDDPCDLDFEVWGLGMSVLLYISPVPLNSYYCWSRSMMKLLRLCLGCEMFRFQLGNKLC